MITIIDYKMGNLGSIANMLKKIGYQCRMTSNSSEIQAADKIILPGVGNFDRAMINLKELGLIDVLNIKALEDKVPVLGICLGMQLMAEKSEEGLLPGLGWIKAEVKKFSFDEVNKNLKIPHMGWNTVQQQKDNRLFSNMYPEPRFYFVHSYHFECEKKEDILTTTFYGYHFTSAVSSGNIMGVQFHPEKSHKFGMMILKNFAEKNNQEC
jgi:glutamine amidotransferase